MRFFVFLPQLQSLHRVLYDSITYKFDNREVEKNSEEVKEAFGWNNSISGNFRDDAFYHILVNIGLFSKTMCQRINSTDPGFGGDS